MPGTTVLPEPPVGSLPGIEGEEPDIDDSFFAADTSELGKAREQAVADLIGGTVVNDRTALSGIKYNSPGWLG